MALEIGPMIELTSNPLLIARGLAMVDLAITLIGVRLHGPGIEANPVHRAVLLRLGPGWFSLLYTVLTVALLRLCAVDEYLLIGLSSGLALAVLGDLCVLARLRRR